MTDQIKVPRATWDAMREALKQIEWSNDSKWQADCARQALTAANAVSDQDLPVGKCGVLSKSEPQAQGEAERLYDAIEDCLLNHRLHNFMEDDESHYPLVDHLSHGDSIEDGRHEIRLICDSIYNNVLKPVHPQATEPAWRPIETAPKDGTLYLAREGADMWVENEPEGHFAGNWEWSESRRQWRGHAHSDDRFATHWMPLPAAPEAKQ